MMMIANRALLHIGQAELSRSVFSCEYLAFDTHSPIVFRYAMLLVHAISRTYHSFVFQICNAGFLVPPSQRGHGIGSVLARSYLHYGPRLGYEASVFNLVYVNNVASVRYVTFSFLILSIYLIKRTGFGRRSTLLRQDASHARAA